MSSQITEKLKKLIAHEASARSIGSLSEAETFAAKIQEMLITHKLSLTEIERDAEEHNEPIAEENVSAVDTGLLYRTRPQREMAALADVVARAFFCRVVTWTHNNTVTFIGRESNRRAAVDLYKLLAVIAKRSFPEELKKWKKAEGAVYGSQPNKKRVMQFKYGYFLGFTRTIQLRFNTTMQATLSSGETGLVLVKKMDTDVDNHLAKMSLRQTKSKPLYFDNAGIAAGDRRASNVSLTSKALL